MSFKLRPEPGRGESPTEGGASTSKPVTTTTAPHSQLTGAGEPSPPPGSATPHYIDDKDIRVLNNLLDDLKKLDTYQGEERLELEVTSRRDSGAGEDLLESRDGDVLLESKGGRAEQVTGRHFTGLTVTSENVITIVMGHYGSAGAFVSGREIIAVDVTSYRCTVFFLNSGNFKNALSKVWLRMGCQK
jgi:hypothetical protein